VNLQAILNESGLALHRDRYEVLQTQGCPPGDYFAVIRDVDEVTVIAREGQSPIARDILASERWFALLEVRVSRPFAAPGFIAKIAQSLADVGIAIFVVSTFSKDYILVRWEARQQALTAATNLGIQNIGDGRDVDAE
jgi:hypothetical protein